MNGAMPPQELGIHFFASNQMIVMYILLNFDLFCKMTSNIGYAERMKVTCNSQIR